MSEKRLGSSHVSPPIVYHLPPSSSSVQLKVSSVMASNGSSLARKSNLFLTGSNRDSCIRQIEIRRTEIHAFEEQSTETVTVDEKLRESSKVVEKTPPVIGEEHTVFANRRFWILFVSFLCGVGTGLAVHNNMGQMDLPFGYADVAIFVFGAFQSDRIRVGVGVFHQGQDFRRWQKKMHF
ncbi:unnamed protein product [Lactuca virosa]|uniref:Uncharacterized protein n=1 Tax=Lactuca virosa TaxID=75947 RepID=A0AAU9MDF3_9ASTR|nr:unnamed protein product [Lactuca virosa]